MAKGGSGGIFGSGSLSGGQGGQSGNCIGNTVYSGGNGGTSTSDNIFSGGGSGASDTSAGNSGIANSTTAGSTTTGTHSNGGAGGNGDNTASPKTGTAPGGGGGSEGYGFTSSSGAGGNGIVIIYSPLGTIVSATGGTHTTDANNDYWTFTTTGTWTPTINYPNLYWVGGTGTWDNSTPTNWSLTTGGSGSQGLPQSTTNVHFDGNSGTGTVTTGASLACANLVFTSYTGTFAGSNTLNIGANLTLGSGMTNTYTGAITFSSTSTGQTITTAGITLGSSLAFNGSGGAWTLQDNITCSAITLTLGTLIATSQTIILSGSGTVWNINGGSFTSGTSTIKFTDATSSAKTFVGGNQTYYNLYLTGSGTGAYTITGSNTFNDFKCDTPPHTINFTAGTTQTLNTFTVSGTAGNLMTLQSTSSGTQWMLRKATLGTVSRNYLSLQDSNVETL